MWLMAQKHEYSVAHVSDQALLAQLEQFESSDRANLARLLAHLGEIAARKLYAPLGHGSMFTWLMSRRGYSEETAYKRIRVAKAARRYPEILPAIASGELHMTAIVLLAPYLLPGNAN